MPRYKREGDPQKIGSEVLRLVSATMRDGCDVLRISTPPQVFFVRSHDQGSIEMRNAVDGWCNIAGELWLTLDQSPKSLVRCAYHEASHLGDLHRNVFFEAGSEERAQRFAELNCKDLPDEREALLAAVERRARRSSTKPPTFEWETVQHTTPRALVRARELLDAYFAMRDEPVPGRSDFQPPAARVPCATRVFMRVDPKIHLGERDHSAIQQAPHAWKK